MSALLLNPKKKKCYLDVAPMLYFCPILPLFLSFYPLNNLKSEDTFYSAEISRVPTANKDPGREEILLMKSAE